MALWPDGLAFSAPLPDCAVLDDVRRPLCASPLPFDTSEYFNLLGRSRGAAVVDGADLSLSALEGRAGVSAEAVAVSGPGEAAPDTSCLIPSFSRLQTWLSDTISYFGEGVIKIYSPALSFQQLIDAEAHHSFIR